MRIISGRFGGLIISPPASMPYTRPTTDLAKTGLFNILSNRIDFTGISCLDLFGGTGCISYELASRGAQQLTIVEKDRQMALFIKKNLSNLKLLENSTVLQQDVFSFLKSIQSIAYHIIFAGPPYSLQQIDDIPKIIIEKKILKEGGIFILEHTPRNNYNNFNSFSFSRNYGTTVFSFFIGS
ncbi:MAG: RsmD family RNA methyltransferase [Phycisphaerales bacterium]|nr:RsmD family RNA methyltransferase [Phycisphaerales bacterium]